MERFGNEHLKTLLSNTNVGMWAYELEDGCPPRMFFDDILKEQCSVPDGLSPEELFVFWDERVNKDSLTYMNKAISTLVEQGQSEALYEWNHPDKGIIHVRTSGRRDYSYKNGLRTEGIQQDISDIILSEREQYEKELSEIRDSARARSVISCLANDYAFVGHINFTNNSIKIFRATSSFMKRLKLENSFPEDSASFKRLILDSIYPDDRSSFLENTSKNVVLRELTNNATYQFDFRLKYKDTAEYYRIKFAKSHDEKNSLTIGVLNVDNYVHAKEREAILKATVQQAERESQAKTSFLFNMSHDIRTPMNAITGYTAMAKKYVNYPDRVTDYLEKIDISGQQLLRLINQVLDMSRIEADKIFLNEEPLDLVARFDDVLTIVDSSARNAGIRLKGIIKNITNRTVYIDDLRMNQVILNILGNAVKYTRPGGMVTASLEQLRSDDPESGNYKITVTDTGIGMSEDFLDKIYDEFSRERNSTSSKIEGTGLGMSIVKKLLDAMGGTIDISSTPGKGTTVTISITFRLADEESVPIKETTQADTAILNGKHVLLVEDNEMNREIAKSILEEYGMIVFEAEDGDIAVKKVAEAENGYYDYVLMDIQMPRMNGFEATRAIRELPDREKSGIPIIAMTANAFAEDKQRVLASGMDAHLPKPIDITDLVITLGRFARK